MQPDLFDTGAVPYQPKSHTSFKAAVVIARKGRGEKLQLLLSAYVAARDSGLNDSEAHEITGLLRSSICSLRKALAEVGLIAKAGERVGAYGIAQQVHVITAKGRKAAQS